MCFDVLGVHSFSDSEDEAQQIMLEEDGFWRRSLQQQRVLQLQSELADLRMSPPNYTTT